MAVSFAQKSGHSAMHRRRRGRRPRRGARCTRAGKRYPLHRSRISDVQARPVVFRLTEGFYNPHAIIRLGVVTALSEPFDQLPGVFSRALRDSSRK